MVLLSSMVFMMHCNAVHSMTNQVLFVKEQGQGDGDRICPRMKKDSQFTLRIPSDLKVQLEEIASSEGDAQLRIARFRNAVLDWLRPSR